VSNTGNEEPEFPTESETASFTKGGVAMCQSRFHRIFWIAVVFGASVVPVSFQCAALANSAREPQAKRKASAAAKTLTFEIYQDKVGEYRWRLKAINKQIIATGGQGYKDKRDCKKAIDRIKADAATRLTFETYADAGKDTRWRLKATNGQIIATSGQGYKDKRDCQHAIDVIKKGAAEADVTDEN
jgi:uncharacterized protein YegP (UPF0339 family)